MDQSVLCAELYDQLQAVANSLADPIFVIDYDGRYVAVLGGRARTHYDSAQSLVGRTLQEVLPELKWRLFLEVVRKAIDTGTLQTCDYQLSSEEVGGTEGDGPAGAQWFQGRVYPVAARPGKRPSAVWLAINISEHKLLEDKLKKLSELDDLTGAYNRRFFLQCLKNETEIARRRSQDLSLIILDADYFKKINDKYGHALGDQILQHLSRTVSSHLRCGNVFARIGGEEFAILCPSTGPREALALAERIGQLVADTPLGTDQGRIFLTISLGVTALSNSDTRIEQLLIRADQALYQAKHNGRNQACCYSAVSPAMRCVQ